MHLSYQEVPLNGIILLTANALSPPRDLQSAAASAAGQKEGKKRERNRGRGREGGVKCCGARVGNTAAQRAWLNSQRHLLATLRCSLTVGVGGGGAGVRSRTTTKTSTELVNRVIEGLNELAAAMVWSDYECEHSIARQL